MKKLSQGARKHIRKQKATIKKQTKSKTEREERIRELYKKFGRE